jgi:ribonuclease HII
VGRRPAEIIIIDGLPLPELGCEHDALVDGDAKCFAIACASIVAKTVRDRLMRRLAIKHPGYGWETNAGYSTELHFAGIRDLGVTRHHRMTFAPCAQPDLFQQAV